MLSKVLESCWITFFLLDERTTLLEQVGLSCWMNGQYWTAFFSRVGDYPTPLDFCNSLINKLIIF